MSTPESEHEFNGIIMMSYTAGEYSDLRKRSDYGFNRLERRDERRGFRRGGPEIIGRKPRSQDDWMDPFPEWWEEDV